MPIYGKIMTRLQRFSKHPIEIRLQFGFHCNCSWIAQSFLPVCVGSRRRRFRFIVRILMVCFFLLTGNCWSSQAEHWHDEQRSKDWVSQVDIQVANIWICFFWSEGKQGPNHLLMLYWAVILVVMQFNFEWWWSFFLTLFTLWCQKETWNVWPLSFKCYYFFNHQSIKTILLCAQKLTRELANLVCCT